MEEITENGKKVLKLIFTDFLAHYNSYNIKGKLKLSNAGSLKLLRSLKDKNLLISEKMGNAIFYKPNLANEYLIKLLELIFLDYTETSSYVRGWIYSLKLLASQCKGILLFGSIMRKDREATDIDVCFILKSSKDYDSIKKRVDEMNRKNHKNIHPLFIVPREFEEKLKQKDAALVDMVRSCIVISGQQAFVEILKNVQS